MELDGMSELTFKWVQDQTRANDGSIVVKEVEDLRYAWYFNFLFYKLDKIKKVELDELKKLNSVENCKKVSLLAKELTIDLGFDPEQIDKVEIGKLKNFATNLYEYAQKKHYTLEDNDEMMMEMAGNLSCMDEPHPMDLHKFVERPGIRQENEKEKLFSFKKKSKLWPSKK
ncbi:hypothetical protein LOD99_8980 [Oopsacas minuta]|uniref:Calponin-homology (CH) domain-containing protein n=1 Tax=Oopsacas minuta TaxID=111878 RepID=A0AAV7JE21_9METZ|nr:hypothetical protein LOD99_8980 [Oopsacas minuta]